MIDVPTSSCTFIALDLEELTSLCWKMVLTNEYLSPRFAHCYIGVITYRII